MIPATPASHPVRPHDPYSDPLGPFTAHFYEVEAVACPACDAQPKRPCVGDGGRRLTWTFDGGYVHEARHLAAESAGFAETLL